MFAEPLQQVDRTYVRYRGRKLIYFAGCDYLRLGSDPRVMRAVERTLRKYGLNVAASRRTTGNHDLYERLERMTAGFFGAEQAILTSNGYMTNLVAAQALAGQITHVFLDERAHQSLKDAAVLLRARVQTFKHRNPGSLGAAFARTAKSSNAAILTDGMFAHDGSIAPLDAYRKIAPSTLLWVDDSHGAGILGKHGRGAIEWFGLGHRNLLQTITFSKAFGVYGGAVLGSKQVCASILSRSGMAAGNTPLPLPLAGGVLEALRITKGPTARKKLLKNIAFFHHCLGKPSPPVPSPIVSVIPSKPKQVAALRERLLHAGIFPSYIHYPGGPESGYFRFAISSEHSENQIQKLAACLQLTFIG